MQNIPLMIIMSCLRLSFIAVMLVKPKRRGSIRSETTYGLKNFLYHTYTIEESVTSDPVCS